MHIHGALFTAWVLVFVTQAGLVAANQTDLHRRLGVIAAVLAITMVVSGATLAIESARMSRSALGVLALLPPALASIRILNAIGPPAFFGVTVVFIAAVIAYDYWIWRRVHAVTLWGGLFLALSFPGRIALGHTDAWLTFARWLVR